MNVRGSVPSRLSHVLARRVAIFTGAVTASVTLALELYARLDAPDGARTLDGALGRSAALTFAVSLVARVLAHPWRSRGPLDPRGSRRLIAELEAPTAAAVMLASGLLVAALAHGAVIGWLRLDSKLSSILQIHAAAIGAYGCCLAMTGWWASSKTHKRFLGATFVAMAMVTGYLVSGGHTLAGREQAAIVAAMTALVTLPVLSLLELAIARARDEVVIEALEDRRRSVQRRAARPGALAVVTREGGDLAIADDPAGALSAAEHGARRSAGTR